MEKPLTQDEMRMPPGELALWVWLRHRVGWQRQYRFERHRRWRFDFANPTLRVAVEVDGGNVKGHGTVWDREKDYEKHNEAVVLGWRVLHGSTAQASDGRLLAYIKRMV